MGRHSYPEQCISARRQICKKTHLHVFWKGSYQLWRLYSHQMHRYILPFHCKRKYFYSIQIKKLNFFLGISAFILWCLGQTSSMGRRLRLWTSHRLWHWILSESTRHSPENGPRYVYHNWWELNKSINSAYIEFTSNPFTFSKHSGPGYYEENHYGIRISDVLHVIDLPESSEFFEGSGALHFEDMSMVPIQTKMININLLSDEEVSILSKLSICNPFHTFFSHTTDRMVKCTSQ